MDIINVAEAKLKAAFDEAAFELNACLHRSADKGSLDRFAKAIQKYTDTRMQMETLSQLHKQVNSQTNVNQEKRTKEK